MRPNDALWLKNIDCIKLKKSTNFTLSGLD